MLFYNFGLIERYFHTGKIVVLKFYVNYLLFSSVLRIISK